MNAPNKIYLQIGDHNYDDIYGDDITWCSDRQDDNDIEYTLFLPQYCTPTQYKEITGKDWPPNGPVWIRFDDACEFVLLLYVARFTGPTLSKNQIIIIANESGKPPANYRLQEATCPDNSK